jgi:hypothetical protein
MQCPAEDITQCRCTIDPYKIVHGTDATFYPKAMCFRVGRNLYTIRLFCNYITSHMAEAMIKKQNCTREIFIRDCTHFTNIRTGLPYPMMAGVCFPSRRASSVYIWRIQRAMRRFLTLTRKWEGRALAVMMALHSRLGGQSCLNHLPDDVLQAIVQRSG